MELVLVLALQLGQWSNPNTGGWESLQLSYGKEVYAFVTHEESDVLLYGKAYTNRLNGIGIGFNKRHDSLRLFGQLGYYFVKNSWGRQRKQNEALEYWWNSEYAWLSSRPKDGLFDIHEVKTKDAMGGQVGFELSHNISDSLSIGFVGAYRVLKIPTEIIAERDEWNYEKTGARWERAWNMDLSGYYFGIGLSLKM